MYVRLLARFVCVRLGTRHPVDQAFGPLEKFLEGSSAYWHVRETKRPTCYDLNTSFPV